TGVRQLIGEASNTVIKLVISQRGHLIPHLAHQLEFQFAAVKIKIWSSLKDVTCIQQKYMRFLPSDFLYQCSPPCHTPKVSKGSSVIGKRLDPGMHVIGMKNGQPFSLGAGKQFIRQKRAGQE